MRPTPILQVEDEETDVVLLQYAFSKADIKEPIYVVRNGREAIDYLSGAGRFADRSAYPLPALVLLDLKLPQSSGFEVLEWIRAQPQLRTTVVIALSSSNHEADVRRAYEAGANSYVVKPADAHSRRQLAEHLKGWWLSCNQFSPPRKAGTEVLPRRP